MYGDQAGSVYLVLKVATRYMGKCITYLFLVRVLGGPAQDVIILLYILLVTLAGVEATQKDII